MGAYVEEGLSSLGRDRTLIFVDTRGRGRSARLIDTTARTFMGDVTDLEVVRAEFRLSKMTLVGWSYAAAVVARYAADHPEAVNKVIMLSPMEPTDSLLQAHMRRVDREALARIDTVKARQLVRWRGAGRDTSDAEAYCRLYWEVNGPMYVADARAAATIKAEWCTLPNEHVRTMGAHVTGVMSSLGSAWDLRLAAGRIRAPVLIVHGERDMVASPDGARAWARAIPGAKLVSVPGAGHLWWVDAPRRVVQEIESFLR